MLGHRRLLPCLAVAATWAVALTACDRDLNRAARRADRLPTPWVWGRAEDVSFLPEGSRVAYLAATARLDGRAFELVPRAHPLVAPRGARLLPVLRVEAPPSRNFAGGEEQLERVVAVALELAGRPGSLGVQIDFDAAHSQRPFYRRVLQRVRAGLADGRILSVAALASWCLGDPWLGSAEIDEVVPMLYRMGPEAGAIRARFDRGLDFTAKECRRAVGVSTDEPVPPLPVGRRVYLFSDTAWTEASWGRQVARVSGGDSQ